jgi:hypothetical protein
MSFHILFHLIPEAMCILTHFSWPMRIDCSIGWGWAFWAKYGRVPRASNWKAVSLHLSMKNPGKPWVLCVAIVCASVSKLLRKLSQRAAVFVAFKEWGGILEICEICCEIWGQFPQMPIKCPHFMSIQHPIFRRGQMGWDATHTIGSSHTLKSRECVSSTSTCQGFLRDITWENGILFWPDEGRIKHGPWFFDIIVI